MGHVKHVLGVPEWSYVVPEKTFFSSKMSLFRVDPLPPPGLAKDQTFYMIFLANFPCEHELRSVALFANEQSNFGATRDCSAAFFMFQPLVNNQEEFQFKPTP